MKWLKEQGTDVNVKDNNGWTPMHHAAKYGRLEVMKWLKDQGADINAKTNDGLTPMHMAANSFNNSIKTMTWLKEQGADINAKTNEGKTPLDLAYELEERFPHIAKTMIEWLKANGAVEQQVDVF